MVLIKSFDFNFMFFILVPPITDGFKLLMNSYKKFKDKEPTNLLVHDKLKTVHDRRYKNEKIKLKSKLN